MMRTVRKWLVRGLLIALAATALLMLVLNIGRFPELIHTTFFQVVATIVALNTMIYAVLGSRKVAALPARNARPSHSVTE
ncbi:MAG: hypothetical protein K0U64_05970 [Actinomycetia bacterium]|nr:hypothetical protein [Actinomycetes bacterium]